MKATGSEPAGPLVPPPGVTGLGRGIGWSYAQLASGAGVGLATAAIVLHRLGPADFGVFALITAVSAFVNALDLSLGLSVVRAAARQYTVSGSEQDAARKELTTSHSAYVIIGAGAVTLMAGLAVFLPILLGISGERRVAVQATTMLVGLSLGVSLATSTLGGVARGQREFRALATSAVAGSVVNLVVVVTLIGTMGLVTLGLAELGSVVCANGLLWLWARRRASWFRLRPKRLAPVQFRRVIAAALPLVTLSIAGQVIATTDLFILGGFYSAAIVGLYRIGSLLPTQAIIALYQGYDVALPALAAIDDIPVQRDTTAFLTRVGCYLGGVGLGITAFLRSDLVKVVSGHAAHLASQVLLVFCGIWLANLVTHGLGLLLIARGRQRVILRPVVAEMIFNLLLTLALIRWIGPVGAALATLITVGISHTILMPLIARREFGSGIVRLVLVDGWFSLATGLLLALVCFLAVSWMGASLVRLVSGGTLALVASLSVGTVLLGKSGRGRLDVLLRRSTPATVR